MDLVDASTSTATEVAKCLSSVHATIDTDCNLVVSAPEAAGSFVPALGANTDAPAYTQLIKCPVTPGDAVLFTFDSNTAVLKTNVLAALTTAINRHIYGNTAGVAKKPSGLATFAAATGKISSGVYVYVVKAKTVVVDDIVVADGTGLNVNTQYLSATTGTCPTGRFGVVVGSITLCPLCPAGTTGVGGSCTDCAAGTGAAGTASSAVGATAACTACAAGTSTGAGYSDCVPTDCAAIAGESGLATHPS